MICVGHLPMLFWPKMNTRQMYDHWIIVCKWESRRLRPADRATRSQEMWTQAECQDASQATSLQNN
jgi:hypothetical protein